MDSKSDDQLHHAAGDSDRSRLSGFAADALGPLDREQMLVHLANCRECRDLLTLMAPEEGPPLPAASPKKKSGLTGNYGRGL